MSLKVLNRVPVRFKDGKTRWITIKGAHVPVDKDGELKGKTGNKIEKGKEERPKKVQQPKKFPKSGVDLSANPPEKNTEAYLKRTGGNARKAIELYYDNELRGGIVKTNLLLNGKNVPVEVVFNRRGKQEFKKFGGYLHKILKVLPFVPDVICKGSYAGRKEEKDHFPESAFHTKMKHVNLGKENLIVAVDIGEDLHERVYPYSVNREGIPSFKRKKEIFEKKMQKSKKKIGDAVLLPSSEDSVINLHRTQSYLRLADESLAQDREKLKLTVLAIRVM